MTFPTEVTWPQTVTQNICKLQNPQLSETIDNNSYVEETVNPSSAVLRHKQSHKTMPCKTHVT